MSDEADSVLVLGATSLVGRFLLPLLNDESIPAVAFSRYLPAVSEGAGWVKGDLGEPDTLGAVGAASEVFALSPIWLLPDALSALTTLGMRRLVAFSSTSALTKAGSRSAEERAVAAKLLDGESRTLDFCAANGIGCVILRPTLIYAEGRDGNVSRLAGLIRRFGVLPLAGRGEGLRQPVHAADLARGALDAMRTPAAQGLYAAPGGETLTYRTMVERVFEGLGKPPRIVSIPAPLFRLALGLAGPLLPGTTQQMGARIADDLVFDPEPARRGFGWSPRGFHPDFSET